MRNIVWITLLVMASCTTTENQTAENETKTSIDSLFEATMEVHDAVMPKIDAVMNFKMAFKAKAAELDSLGEDAGAYREMIGRLDSADEAMMHWMRTYARKPADSIAHDEAVRWLNESQSVIDAVRDSMSAVLTDSEKLQEGI